MDESEYVELHKRFAASLDRYTKEAKKLCELLGKCLDGPLSTQLHSEIAVQRSAENEAHAEYNEHRVRLLAAARFGYRDSDQSNES